MLAFGALLFLMRRLTGIRLPALTAAFVLGGAYFHSLLLGQFVPFGALALVGAAVSLRARRYMASAAMLAILACEPQLALGSWIAVAAFVPQARRWLFAGAFLLVLLSLWAVGPFLNAEYLWTVLPLHIASELRNEMQFGVSPLVFSLGASEATAVAAGRVAFGIAIVLGVLCAGILARKRDDLALLVLIPPVFSLLLGPFTHVQHVALALPAALLVYSQFPRLRFITAAIVVAIAVPWADLNEQIPPFIVTVALAGTLSVFFFNASRGVGIAVGIVLLFLLSFARVVFPAGENVAPVAATLSTAGDALAESSWREHVDAAFRSESALYTVLKLPTWTGLSLLAGLLVVLAARRTPPERLSPAAPVPNMDERY